MFGSCCCCISLSAGTKIIGIITVITSSLITALYAAPLFIVPYLEKTKLVFYSTVAATSAVHCVLTCLMLYASFQKKPKFFWPWILLSWLMAGVLILLSTSGLVFVYQDQLYGNTEVMVMISLYIIYGVLLIYFGLVVKSRATELTWDLLYLRKHTRYTELSNRPTYLYN